MIYLWSWNSHKKIRIHQVTAKLFPQLLTHDQRDNRIAFVKKFWTTGDETLVYGFVVATKMSLHSELENILQVQETLQVRLNVRSHIDGFLTSMLCESYFFPLGQTVNYWYSLEVLKCPRENDPSCVQTILNSSITIMCQLTYCYWFVTFCLLGHSSQQTFYYFQNWNPLWKVYDFQGLKMLRKHYRQNYTSSQKRATRTISRSGNVLGVVHQCKRGVLWRR